ncbi:MAG: hypothetical protein JXQ85_09775 [Cognatishimia sp.]|uniref:hypothetical protein n=1 Tax=Cognatishimia sp. TaxID=2211648 RepID=UPI003B8ACAAD
MKYAIAVLTTLGLALLAWLADIPTQFGAHPWWGQKVLMTGALIGLALGVAVHWISKGHMVAAILLIATALVGFAVAKYGQTQFAATFAEDRFAGTLWFFGWHVTSAFAFAGITSLCLLRRAQ